MQSEQRENGSSHADGPFDDDGVDPRRFFDRRQSVTGADAKLARLVREAQRVLEFEIDYLTADFDAPVEVVAVTPAPDATRLNVSVRGGGHDDILGVLNRHRGRLRSEIARALNRRRTPELTFTRAMD